MKAEVARTLLLNALGHVQRIVEEKNIVPLLSNVLIVARDGKLELRGTDLDIEAVEAVTADIIEDGATTVRAHTLHEIVRRLPDGAAMTLEMGAEDRLVLLTGHSRYEFPTLNASDFPKITTGEFTHRFTLSAADLKRMIDAKFAMSTDETRYFLNGVFFHALDLEGTSMLRAVATDGHRLARVELAAPNGGIPGIIVPRKAAVEISKLLEEASEVSIAVSDTNARFQLGAITLTTKLIDGNFPDYQRILPLTNDKRLVIEREPFEKAVDRISTMASERSKAVKLTIADGGVTLSVNNPELGEASEEINATYDAEPLTIGFNSGYLLDIIRQLTGEHMLVLLATPEAPALIQENDGAAALYVLMPLRV